MAGDDLAPLFIVGAPRSGTSLLYKLLCLHPRAAWISNWARRAPGVPAVVLLNRLAPRMPATRRRTWFGSDGASAYVYGRPRALVERLFPMPVEGEPVYRHCGIGTGAAGVPERQTAALRRSFAREQGRDPWELCALHWVQELAVIQEGLAAVPAGRQLEVRYEQLIRAPVETVRSTGAFAGLSPDPAWTAELPRLRYPNKDEAWRERLPPEARDVIEHIQRDDLRRLGHAV